MQIICQHTVFPYLIDMLLPMNTQTVACHEYTVGKSFGAAWMSAAFMQMQIGSALVTASL